MKVYTSIIVTLLLSSNIIFSQCIDTTLINPTGMCPLQYDPICGCNGKTYQNACLAQITDGVMMGSPGSCPIDSTYTVCEGESIQIGLSNPVGGAQYNWNPPNVLSCSDCYNPVTTPTTNMMYELEVIDSTSTSSYYYYYEVMVDNNCPVACIDTSLIDPNAICSLQYDPVCGCDGKTYSNACFAEVQGGLTSWTTGVCSVNETYVVCEGENIQIEFLDTLNQATYTWNPANNLSCTDCPNPIVTPTSDLVYELTVTDLSNSINSYYYYEVSIDYNCVVACVDSTLVDPAIICDTEFDPVCGCNNKTYINACLAEFEGGLTSWTSGTCPIAETYTICTGDSIQIGLDEPIENTVLRWRLATGLSCTDCPSPYASPTSNILYELSISSTIDQTTNYQYYLVNVDSCISLCEGTPIAYQKTGFNESSPGQLDVIYCFDELIDSNEACNWQWDFGNGTTSNQQNPCDIALTSTINGEPVTEPYNVCLSVFDCDSTLLETCCLEIDGYLPCQDDALIDSTAVCSLQNDPVCGCDGRTYANTCLAEKEGGLNYWTQGACAITQTYTICPGDSIQIGMDEMVGNTVLTWKPANTLSCVNCPGPYASPVETTIYELHTFTTIGMTNQYTYYEVIIDEDCPLLCTNNNVVFSYEKTGFIEVSDPIYYGANKYCFQEISPVEDDCSYFWNFGNGGSISTQNPCNIEFPYIKNGSPVENPLYNVCLTVYRCDGTTIGTCCVEILSEASVCECTNIDAPVCGVDGNTYPNACSANCEFIDVAYTGNCCDINNLTWLDEVLVDICNDCIKAIEFIEFEGSNYIALWADDMNCSDAITTIYNCDGTEYCTRGGIAGLNDCPDLTNSYTVIESIWEKEIYCGVCGYDNPTQVDWLQSLTDGSYSVNTYNYNGETVFYLDNCDFGLDYVTTCDSTFVCGWGGPDNLDGENCLDFFAEATFIEEIIPCACIDLSLLNPSPSCPPFYAPVCGCDGVTYSNFCLAKAQGGVTSWVAGPCGSGPCIDTISIANTFLSSGTYKANLVLQVASKALEGHSINLHSGENVELLEGFDLPTNSNLKILNTYCD